MKLCNSYSYFVYTVDSGAGSGHRAPDSSKVTQQSTQRDSVWDCTTQESQVSRLFVLFGIWTPHQVIHVTSFNGLKVGSHRATWLPSRNVHWRHLWSFWRSVWRAEWIAYPFLPVSVRFMMESLGVNEPLISQIKLMVLVDGEAGLANRWS